MVQNPFQRGLAVQVGGDASGANRALQSVMGNLTSMKTLALGAGVAVAAALGKEAVDAAREFDAAMTESLAIMGDVSDAMRKDMSQAAREVAKTTTFSAEQAAESYFFLASAGLEAKESIEALPVVSQFAQAGMFDMARATDLLTDSASALGLAVEDYNRLADVLVKANTLANASVEQFATALKRRAAAEMRNANIELEEGVAVLAAFADQGIKAQRAGQVFQRTLLTLQEATRENADAVERLGVRIFDSSGEMRGMADIIEDLTKATADMSTEERNAALESLGFTRRTREGIVALLGKSDAIREYQGELENAGGTTEEVADKQLESFNAQLNLLQSRLKDAAITIGNEMIPALEFLIRSVNNTIDSFEDFNDELEEFNEKGSKEAVKNIHDLDSLFVALAVAGAEAKDVQFGVNESIRDFDKALSDALHEGELQRFQTAAERMRDVGRAGKDAARDVKEGMDDASDSVKSFIDDLQTLRRGAAGGLSIPGIERLIQERLPELMKEAEAEGLTGQRASFAIALQEAAELLGFDPFTGERLTTEEGEPVEASISRLTELPKDIATQIAAGMARQNREEQTFRQDILNRLQEMPFFEGAGEGSNTARLMQSLGANMPAPQVDVSTQTDVAVDITAELAGEQVLFRIVDQRIDVRERRAESITGGTTI